MERRDWHKSILALVVWREAMGESKEGKLAVANVIRNRVLATHLPDQWDNIIFRRWQFSSMTASWSVADEAKAQIKKGEPLPASFLRKHQNNILADPMLAKWPSDEDPSWIDSMDAAEQAMTSGIDNTQGSTFYANLSVCDPAWAHTLTQTVKIGHHTFFRDKAVQA